MKERIKHLILLIILVAIDQITKYWVRIYLNKPMDIIPGVLSLEHINNTGAAWSILKDSGLFLRIITLMMLIIIVFVYFHIPAIKKYNILKLLAVFIMAGALGNLIDRFLLGHVVDFISFEIINFPLFNFADSCLTVSCIILFILALFYYKDDDFAFLNKAIGLKRDKSESISVSSDRGNTGEETDKAVEDNSEKKADDKAEDNSEEKSDDK